MPSRALVVAANILVRAAVLGRRVRELIEMFAGEVSFFVPESAYAEAEEHLAALVIKRGGDPEKALALLRSLGRLVDLLEARCTASSKRAREMPDNGLLDRCVACPPRRQQRATRMGMRRKSSRS